MKENAGALLQNPYYSCNMINSFYLNFNGMLDTDGLTMCCENIADKPQTFFAETAQETIQRFLSLRKKIIAESKKFSSGFYGERKYTAGCANCANWQLNDWQSDGKIHYVNLSMYPAPCQCKCCYCNVHNGKTGKFIKEIAAPLYEKMFAVIDYARASGIIVPDAAWQISSGEIAIHPYKDKILSYVKNQRTMFYTNCFIFDKNIAENLKSNPHSAINLSIDAGTSTTWKKVKGIDNFNTVIDTLAKYYESSARPGQITLKYILLPDMNDSVVDFQSVIEIMKILQVKHLTLSRDINKKYMDNDPDKNRLLSAAGVFIALLNQAECTFDLFTFTPDERQQIIILAKKLLSSKLFCSQAADNTESKTTLEPVKAPPLVRVVTCTYNGEKTLERTAQSVLKQTYGNFEYIILDHGSTDGTRSLIEKLARQDQRVKPIFAGRIPNIYTEVVKLFQGDFTWFAILDHDDVYDPRFLEVMVNFANQNNLDLAACGSFLWNASNGQTSILRNTEQDFMLDTPDSIDLYLPYYHAIFRTVWAKIYHHDLLQKCEWLWSGKDYHPDTKRAFNALLHSQKAGVTHEILHTWTYTRKSQSHQIMPSQEGNADLRVMASINTNLYVEDVLRERTGHCSIQNALFLLIVWMNDTKDAIQIIQGSDLPQATKLKSLKKMLLNSYGSKLAACENFPHSGERSKLWLYSRFR